MEKSSPSLSFPGLASLMAVATLTIMVGCVIVPALPSIAVALHLQGRESWLITLPSLGVAVFGAIAGRAIDRFGARTAVIVGLLLYGFLGLIGAVLLNPWAAFADRFLLGGATALVMASGTALISDFYQGDTRLKMMARQGMAIELGGVVFLSIGGMLAELGWQWPYLLYALAWVFCLMIVIFLPSPPRSHDAPSVGGPVRLHLVGDIYLAACGSMILFFCGVITIPHALAAMGFSESATGYFLAFTSLTAVCAASQMPRVNGALGPRWTLGCAFLAYACGYGLFSLATSLPLALVSAILIGSGFGLSIPLVNHEAVERSPAEKRGRILAYLSVAIFMGQFLSSFVPTIFHHPTRVFTADLAIGLILAVLTILLYGRVTDHKRS